jgi:hypothetical protein
METPTLKIALSIFLVLLLGINSCEHDSLLDEACGTNDPSENIIWLKNLITDINTNQNQNLETVGIRNYKSQDIIMVTWSLVGIQDAPTGSIYNCNGDLLYICGGNQPVDSCSYILINSQLTGYIWTKK